MWLLLLPVIAAYFIDFGSETAKYFTIFSASLFGASYVYKHIKRYSLNLPPGPAGLPLLGYILFLGKEPHKTLNNLAKKYGNIYSLYLGPRYVVVVTQIDIAREILTHPCALDRPPNIADFAPGKGGFSALNGEEWQEQRRFCIQALKDLGLGKGSWEQTIKANASDLVEELASYQGKATDFYPAVSLSQSSNIISLLIGKRLVKGENDKEREIITKTLKIIMEYVAASKASIAAPWAIKYLVMFRIAGYHKADAIFKEFSGIFRKYLALRNDPKSDEDTHDFIALYRKKAKESIKHSTFTEEKLHSEMINLFLGGSDTTTTSLRWLLLLMASYPDVQKKVHEEIDDVIGRDGTAYWDDRYQFPYTMATIMEMERYISIAAINGPRCASDDFKIRGYTIPKGTIIAVNNWALTRDPKYFKDPENFFPERFLKPGDNKTLQKLEGYQIFSVGKRNCPGETVAMMSIFLYFTDIMQKFTIKSPPGEKPNLEPIFGAVLHPKSQNLCFIERGEIRPLREC